MYLVLATCVPVYSMIVLVEEVEFYIKGHI